MPGGRPPSGPKLVDTLEGSMHAKARLEVVLETIAGRLTVADACAKLKVGETAFRKIRTAALSGALKELEPKQVGRPAKLQSPDPEYVASLEKDKKWLEEELEVARVRQELAATMPVLTQHAERREAMKARRAEEKKRRRLERRARARSATQRRAADAVVGGSDRPGGDGGDSTGGVPAGAGGEGTSPLDDAAGADAGAPGRAAS